MHFVGRYVIKRNLTKKIIVYLEEKGVGAMKKKL
jgi:hypothetical protein